MNLKNWFKFCTFGCMKFFPFYLFFLLLNFSVFSQLEFEKTTHNFGDLYASDQRFVDIEVKNIGKKKEYFLSFRKPKDVVCLSKGEYVMPDSSSFIRIQVNPRHTGKFSYELQIFTSDRLDAIIIKVSGNLREMPDDALANYQACPDFSARPVRSQLDNKFTIYTVDAFTRKPVPAQVFIIQNGVDISKVFTKNGIWKGKLPLGFTYFYASAETYISTDTSMYINMNRNEITIELRRKPVIIPPEIIVVDSVLPEEVVEIEIPISQEEKPIDRNDENEALQKELSKELPESLVKSEASSSLSALDSIPLENFDPILFKSINVVFVLDVSSSMGAAGKFDLLKFSLRQLLDILRPQDKMGFVTYATHAKVLLPSISGNEKEKILSQIRRLTPSGQTAGMDGIKLGFEEAEKNFIPEGTNIVIIITDGAFNKNNGNYLELIRLYQEKNIEFSVIGIKNTDRDRLNMQEAAEAGKGAYVPVFRLADARNNVIREIKRATYKGY